MRCGTIGSCQSAATSEIVKRCWSCKWRYSKYPDLYLYLLHAFMQRSRPWSRFRSGLFGGHRSEAMKCTESQQCHYFTNAVRWRAILFKNKRVFGDATVLGCQNDFLF